VQAAEPVTREMLDGLGQRWRAHELPAAQRLRPGLGRDQAAAMVAAIDLALPAEAQTWWEWHDGLDREGAEGARDVEVAGNGFGPLSLSEGVEMARMTAPGCRDLVR